MLLLVVGLLVSCSTDGSDDTTDQDGVTMGEDMMEDDTADENGMDEDAMNSELVGFWVLSEVRLDEEVEDTTLELLKLVIDNLFQQECYLITFDFMANGMVDAVTRASDFEVTGSDIMCPEESESATAQWSLEDDQLTLIDENGEEETITVVFEDDNTMIIQGEEAIEEDFANTEAVLIRLEN